MYNVQLVRSINSIMSFPKLLILSCLVIIQGEANVQLSDVKMCTNKNYPLQLSDIGVRPAGNNIEVKMKFNLIADIGNDNQYQLSVEKMVGDKLKPIIGIKQKGACNGLLSYGGDIFLKGAKQAKLPHPETCPIAKGKYDLDWYHVDLAAIPLLRLVPAGKFKATVRILKSSGNDEITCIQCMVEKN